MVPNDVPFPILEWALNPICSTLGVLRMVFVYKAVKVYKYFVWERERERMNPSFPWTCFPLGLPFLSFPLILDFFQSLNFKYFSTHNNLSSLDCLTPNPGQELSNL